MIALVASLALAASPGGFRSGEGLPAPVVALRAAVVPGPYAVGQATLRGRWAGLGNALTFELPVIVAADPDHPTLVGVGQSRFGASHALDLGGKVVTFSAGLELALPLSPRSARAFAWAETPRSALPSTDLLAVYELAAFPRAPLVVRGALGVSTDAYTDPIVTELVVAQVLPVRGPFSAVGEVELGADWVDVAGRALARLDLPAGDGAVREVSVDVGAQGMLVDGVVVPGVLAQVRTWFRNEPARRPPGGTL